MSCLYLRVHTHLCVCLSDTSVLCLHVPTDQKGGRECQSICVLLTALNAASGQAALCRATGVSAVGSGTLQGVFDGVVCVKDGVKLSPSLSPAFVSENT